MADDAPPLSAARIDRRTLIGGLAATCLAGPAFGAEAAPVAVTIATDGPTRPIDRHVFGNNEYGTMDGGEPSAAIDARIGIPARRLGGNLMTPYNWVNNFTNAGKDWHHANGEMLTGLLDIDPAERRTPGAVVFEMQERCRAMAANALITLPLAGFVAADGDGVVAPAEAAPSKRFVPVSWEFGRRADDAIDRAQSNIPHLLAKLVAKYGPARDGGVWGYALDNEPGLWPETHPRVVPKPAGIGSLIERSIKAAKAIKAVDPTARVFGPAAWGATEMIDFQHAADWPEYRQFGSFLGAYLAAFRTASEAAGLRLLDVLDVHWYAFSRKGVLFRSDDPRLAGPLLDAPRSLDDADFREDSWVADALRGSGGDGVELPLLPSLHRLIGRHFPGTELAISEFNYGGAGQLVSGLALADALGRMATGGVGFASHWGSLGRWLGEAYRLYLARDPAGRAFGDIAFGIRGRLPPSLSVYASGFADAPGEMSIVVINKAETGAVLDLGFTGARPDRLKSVIGFDAAHPETVAVTGEIAIRSDGRLVIPARAARRYRFG